MKKLLIVIISFILIVSLIACSNQNKTIKGDEQNSISNIDENEIVIEKQEGVFILRLVSKKKKYTPHEQEVIFSQIKYVGPKINMVIQHGGSMPVSFRVTETTRNITIPPITATVLKVITLQKDKWYTFTFNKSGEVKEDEFYQEYFKQTGFPKGKYTIEASFSFKSDEEQKYNIVGNYAAIKIGSIDIVVE